MIINSSTLLDSYNSNTLWDMAREAHLPGTHGKKLKKADLLRLMQQMYFKPERIKASYRQLTATERDVLNRLLLNGGSISTRMFKRQLIRAGLATEAEPPSEPKKKDSWFYRNRQAMYGKIVPYVGSPDPKSTVFEDVMARLTLRGLIFSADPTPNTGGTNYKFQLHPGETLVIPSFVSQYLPKPEPLPVTKNDRQPDHVLHGDPQLFLRDLYLYWDTVRRSDITMIQAGFVGKRGLKQLNEAILTPDPTLTKARQEDQTTRLYLLRQLLQNLNLVTVQAGTLRVTGRNQAIPEFWNKTTTEQVTAVLNIWRDLTTPFQFPNDGKYYQFYFNVRQACQHLLTGLAEMPTTWVEAEDLLIWLQDRNSNFLFSQRSQMEGRHSSYYYGYYGDPAKLINEMNQLEQRFLAEVMADILFRMGLVELDLKTASAKPTEWQAFRLTPLGTAVFKKTSTPTDTPTGQIIVQPSFQILAMGPVPLNLLAQLDLFAERQKTDPTAFEYHLSRESVYMAQQNGFSVDDIQQFLEQVTPNELPQNIRRSLAEWAADHDRIVFRTGVNLLQAADDALLEKLLTGSETGKLFARPVGNAVALVKSNQKLKLVSALQDAGLLPAVSGANPEAADKSVVVDENGRIQPIHAVPSLHLRGRLARFTAETDNGWQLTEQSIRRAGGSKKKVNTIVEELGKLSRGKLPKALISQIRAWGGYYGKATVGTMTLFEFRDQSTLDELRQLPELKELLHPFPAGSRALAVVDEEQVTAVQSILTQLGVQISPITN